MTVFNRFMLWLVLLGVTLALAIVLAANWRSATRQAGDLARERKFIKSILSSQPPWSTQAQFAVKSKELDSEGQTSRTTIAWRWLPYHLPAPPSFSDATASSATMDFSPPPPPTPVQLFSFPGDRIDCDALVLGFDAYAGTDESTSLQGITIAFLARIYAPDAPPTDRITLTPDGDVPMVFRHDPTRVSQAEAYLWRDIAELIRTPALAQRKGLEVHWTAPARITVQPGYLYEVNLQKDPTALSGFSVRIVPHDDKDADRRALLFPPPPATHP